MFTLTDVEAATALVHTQMPATPQFRWPLLEAACRCELWVKHENHTPTGAFKVRGGIVYVDRLRRRRPDVRELVSATRGNHGQSLAFAGCRAGFAVTVVVPHGNAIEKNRAMQAWGAEVVEAGADFDEARRHAETLAAARGATMVPSFDPDLVLGVATYAVELFRAVPGLDVVYVPIGLGSGISGLIRTRDLLGLRTEIVGVVAAGAPAYARSFAAGQVVTTERAVTFADGMACRVPDAVALATIRAGAARVIELSEAEIADAVRLYFAATHNAAEGAGAAPLAGLLRERATVRDRRTAVVLCGGNVDTAVFAQLLAGDVPAPF